MAWQVRAIARAAWVAALAGAASGQGGGPFVRWPGALLEGHRVQPDRLGDVNGDGVEDFATFVWGYGRNLVFSGFDRSLLVALGGSVQGVPPGGVTGADVTGDGRPEIVWAVEDPGLLAPGGVFTGRLRVFDGSSLSPLWWVNGEQAGDQFGVWPPRRLGDLNGDGLEEVFISAEGYNYAGRIYVVGAPGIFLNTITGSPTHAVAPGGTAWRLGDLDLDGVEDFGVQWYAIGGSNWSFEIYSGSSLGNTLLRVHPMSGFPVFSVGDVNGDSSPEYVMRPPVQIPFNPGYPLLLYDGASGVVLRQYVLPGASHPLVGDGGRVEDVDGDGFDDFVVSNGFVNSLMTATPGAYVVSTMSGRVLQVLMDHEVVYPVGDLDADGRVDVGATAREIPTGTYPFTSQRVALWFRRTLSASPHPAPPGSVLSLQADVPAHANGAFRILMSGSVGRGGVSIGSRRVPLTLDGLFEATLWHPSLFGYLDATGRATATMAVPADPALSGSRIYAAVITFHPDWPYFVKTIGAPEEIVIQ